LVNKLTHWNGYGQRGPGPQFTQPASGSTDDWAYGTLGAASMTLELGTVFHEPCDNFETFVLPVQFPVLDYAAKVSSRPYALAKGPDIVSLTVSSPIVYVSQGDGFGVVSGASTPPLVTLFMAASDYEYGASSVTTMESTQQGIAEIRLYINVHPYDKNTNKTEYGGDGGMNHPNQVVDQLQQTQPTDRAYGSIALTSSDFLETSVDGGLSTTIRLGRHTIYLEAVDTDGNVGPVSAIWVTILAQPDGSDESSSTTQPSPSKTPSPSPTSSSSLECHKGDLVKCNDDANSDADAGGGSGTF
jgi:carboxypeptidase T